MKSKVAYSVSSLETTIFRQIGHFFRHKFLQLLFNPKFLYSYGGQYMSSIASIRVWKFGVNQELRIVLLKLTLTNKIIWRKIVVSWIETLYETFFGKIPWNQLLPKIFYLFLFCKNFVKSQIAYSFSTPVSHSQNGKTFQIRVLKLLLDQCDIFRNLL